MAAEIIPVERAAKYQHLGLLQQGRERFKGIILHAGFACDPAAVAIQAGTHRSDAAVKYINRMPGLPCAIDKSRGQDFTVATLACTPCHDEHIFFAAIPLSYEGFHFYGRSGRKMAIEKAAAQAQGSQNPANGQQPAPRKPVAPIQIALAHAPSPHMRLPPACVTGGSLKKMKKPVYNDAPNL